MAGSPEMVERHSVVLQGALEGAALIPYTLEVLSS